MGEQIKRQKRSKNFTTLDLTVLRDENLSWQAKGLHSYLMQLPDDWKVYVKDLQSRATNGRDSVSNILNELINKGYLTRNRVTEKGKFVGYDYIIYEHPAVFTENGKTENGKTENGKTENGKTENGKPVTNNRLKEVNIKLTKLEEEEECFLEKNRQFFEKLDNDEFTFNFLMENVGVSEKQLKELWGAVTKAFDNQLISNKRRHDDYDSFSLHFRNYCFKRIPSIIKQNSKANDTNGTSSGNAFKSKAQVRDEYNAQQRKKLFDNLDRIVAGI